MRTKILSWLLHHANKLGRNYNFYQIKNKILTKYGKHICYDVQFIEGKICWSCDGTGTYEGDDFTDTCRNCAGSGMYKNDVWNILAKIQFGKYTFHQPYKRVYKEPEIILGLIINDYISHKPTKYGKFALNILFLLYDKRFLRIKFLGFWFNFKRKFRYFKSINKLSLVTAFSHNNCTAEDDMPF